LRFSKRSSHRPNAPPRPRALAAHDGANLSRFLQALAVHTTLDIDTAGRANRARRMLVPRDARAAVVMRAADPSDLAAALDALVLEGPAPSMDEEAMIAAIARRLVPPGRADLAYEAMRTLSGRLARAVGLEAEPRLRLMSVVATLSAAVLAAARDQTPTREGQIVPLVRTLR
jgi:acetylornithine deacetylase/succinyl-diaminopimelate desuccinylase-like protein